MAMRPRESSWHRSEGRGELMPLDKQIMKRLNNTYRNNPSMVKAVKQLKEEVADQKLALKLFEQEVKEKDKILAVMHHESYEASF